MEKAPIPKNDKERLESLWALKILDTRPEERFDRITNLATRLLHVSISTITLVDKDREWFKSCKGLPATEGPRDISFCGHAAFAKDILIIPDTQKDPRFSDNPMVIEAPFIRFYAGHPLFSTDGQRIGVFCIKDHEPKNLTEDQIELIKALAAWAELEVNLHNLSIALSAAKKIEKERMENELLKKQNDFISTISHQLRTPASAIGMGINMLKDQITDKETLADLLSKISNLNDLIGTLLFSIENNRKYEISPKETAEIDLTELIQNNIALVTKKAESKKISINFTPPQTKQIIMGDLTALNRVVYSLLDNAIIYNKEHGVVKIEISEKAKNVKIEISDKGIGIPQEEQKGIFARFFRATNASLGKNEGSGISLYIFKLIIEAHKGKVGFESKENVGSSFYFSLPKK